MNFEYFQGREQINHLISSGLLLLIIWIIKFAISSSIRKSTLNSEYKRKWVIHVRNYSSLVFVIGLAAIWSTELQAFALSIVAIAAAIVIATKELILCFLGGFLRASNHPFSVGDRIEINNYRGDVIDTSLLTTKIMEIGPFNITHQYTGRAITIPNSIFLANPVVNESFMDQYVLHVFQIPMKLTADWKRAEGILLKLANEECSAFIQKAKLNFDRVGRKEGLEVPSVEPRVTYHVYDEKSLRLVVRVPAPSSQKGKLEHTIVKRFLEEFYGQKE
ncbi:MAG: mechanosensitive ion channel family protein [Oligoflexia bacterium]|nr:mechanosensitive ion channel family protein [Oligoflexia bacterium]